MMQHTVAEYAERAGYPEASVVKDSWGMVTSQAWRSPDNAEIILINVEGVPAHVNGTVVRGHRSTTDELGWAAQPLDTWSLGDADSALLAWFIPVDHH